MKKLVLLIVGIIIILSISSIRIAEANGLLVQINTSFQCAGSMRELSRVIGPDHTLIYDSRIVLTNGNIIFTKSLEVNGNVVNDNTVFQFTPFSKDKIFERLNSSEFPTVVIEPIK